MKLVRTIESLRTELTPLRRQGKTIGVVPTMGFLHEGHRSLMRASVDSCDVTVLTLFVNPTQFHDPKDLAAYPRDEKRDAAMAEEAGVDFLFAPEVAEMYPAGASTPVVRSFDVVAITGWRDSGSMKLSSSALPSLSSPVMRMT